MTNQKSTGSYYTPSYLANFISKRVLSHFDGRTRMSILEPSVGDGVFLEELEREKNLNIRLTALDINEIELNIASKKWSKKSTSFIKADFLQYSSTNRFSAIIGNPPYIKKNRLSENQIQLSKEIHFKENLSDASVKNIWATFIVKSNTLLNDDGVLAFVLPSELLQVEFAKEINTYLNNKFERIEIFTFNDLLFECKGQDTIVLFAYKRANEPGEFFANIESREDLENNTFQLRRNDLLIDSNIKRTHHFLSNEELTFLEELKGRLKIVNDYTDSKPGIVTAANKFFIIDRGIEEKYDLSKYTKPIIQKGLFVNGSVVFNNEDFKNLQDKKIPTKLLQLNDSDKISKKLRTYLDIGEVEEIPKRYKCKIRNNWYVIPNISEKPEAFFFKRSHLYPKLLKNTSNAFVTDSAYKVNTKNNYDLNSFIYSFYNTLTLIYSELNGRYYGGGVLELTPNEFKNLPVPYLEINDLEFEDFTERFENKYNIEDILHQNDYKILNTTLGMNNDEIKKLSIIRSKLINKRMRNK